MTRARDVANLIGSGNYSSTTFTATAGQTVFSIAHTQNFVQVFMNGLLLDLTVDYTSNGSAVTLTSGAAAGDEIEVVAYNTFSVGDALNQAAADTRYVNSTGDTVTGALTVDTSTTTNLTVDSANYGGLQFKAAGTDTGYITSYTNGSGAESMYIGGADTVNLHTGTNHALTNGTTRLQIDGSGRVTMPNQPSFGAYQATGNYTVGSGWGKMIADGTRWNEGSHYSTTNSRFTAPLAGVYHFTANVNSYSIADDLLFGVALYVNGSGHTMGSRFYSRGAADLVASMSHTVKLSATDYVEIYYYSNDTSHGFSSGTVWNTFSGFLVG